MPRTGYTKADQRSDDDARDDALRYFAKTGEYLDPFTTRPPAPSIDESHERFRRLAKESQR